MDFRKKEISLGEAIWTTDDYDADLLKVRRLYKKEMAKYPDMFIEVDDADTVTQNENKK